MSKQDRARSVRDDFESGRVVVYSADPAAVDDMLTKLQELSDVERETRLRKVLQDLDKQRKDAHLDG